MFVFKFPLFSSHFQIHCHLVASATAVQESCAFYDFMHLDYRIWHHHTMGIVFRFSTGRRSISRCTRYVFVSGGMASRHQWQFVFPVGPSVGLLCPAHGVDNLVLCANMDKSVNALDTWRYQGCANGPNATKVQSEGYQNVSGRGHIVCVILAAALCNICTY